MTASTQPIGCLGCRDEATFVASAIADKRVLAEIRRMVDKKYD